MKLFFVTGEMTEIADRKSPILFGIKDFLLKHDDVEEVRHPAGADVVLIQEDKDLCIKDFRYIDRLLHDPFISAHLTKIFTINTDDFSTGLLRGLYTSMPKSRCQPEYHRVVPYIEYTNPHVFADRNTIEPGYLAAWYGNTKSNKLRKVLVEALQDEEGFFVKTSESWYNHKADEQKAYVELIESAKFSLCPAGWCPPTPRIYESMALGRCPVIIADGFARPHGPRWDEFALFLPEKDVAKLPAFLRAHEANYKELGKKAKENWDQFFAGDLLKQYFADSMLSLIRSTPAYTKEMEIKRWRSFSTFWNNRWTIPQRIVNRCRLILEGKLETA